MAFDNIGNEIIHTKMIKRLLLVYNKNILLLPEFYLTFNSNKDKELKSLLKPGLNEVNIYCVGILQAIPTSVNTTDNAMR